ncbi:Hypothetical predicted protein [Drosophila guanche]|uniref:Uncharacterized protein n=1 Tax=Drosophila guanche TaxID=7266 RepID=A0A3B0JZV9_DROGU|nr:Hypothetical predicted protein [Drosophila guanche]
MSTLCWLVCASMLLGVACATTWQEAFSREELQKYGPKRLIEWIKANYPNIAEVCWSKYRAVMNPGGGGVLPAVELQKFKDYVRRQLVLLHVICNDGIYELYKT